MKKLSERRLLELRQKLDACTGADAWFNAYKEDFQALILAVHLKDAGSGTFGISFSGCTHVAGPTQWESVQFSLAIEDFGDGDMGFVVEDAKAGFKVRCLAIGIAGERSYSFDEVGRRLNAA